MSDRTLRPKKATASNFSNPSLVSPTTPTLANPTRGFGLPTNNVVQTATEVSTELQELQSADAQVSDPFGYCYSGDNRGFSNAIHASYRTHQEIEFDTSTGRATINYKDTGTSHDLECRTARVLNSAKAPTSELTNGSVIRSGSNYRINFQADAKNPLAWYACNINLDLTLSINPAARTCSIEGTHDGFPAYEVYVTANGGSGTTLYTYDPISAGKGPGALCGGSQQTASGTVSF